MSLSCDEQVEKLTAELKKAESKKPSKVLETLVLKLRNQLEEKEKKQKENNNKNDKNNKKMEEIRRANGPVAC